MSETEFLAVVDALKTTFDLSDCEEFTVECNPESVTESLAKTWLDAGVDRVSMGVQTFSDKYLFRLGRLHDRAKALESYQTLQKVGFRNISLDLMMALPEETNEDLREDLKQLIALSPQHCSVYLLKIEAESVFGKQGMKDAPDEVQREHYLIAHQLLAEAGYEHYEISNFAKPGFRAKHNTVYWKGGEYLAFGPGASGYCDGVRYHIPADTSEFCAKAGHLQSVLDEVIDREEAKKEAVFLGLRLSEGIPAALIPPEKQAFAARLCSEGFATMTQERFALTPEGFLVSDYVIRELLPER